MVSFASWLGMEHTPDNERLVLLAFLSLSPLERGGFLLLFNFVTNVCKHRRCDLFSSPRVLAKPSSGQPGVEMAHPPENPEAMSCINGWMGVEGYGKGWLKSD